MKSDEVRKRFLDFFESKRHEIVASAPLVVKDDPSLMFTNAGMNQFKEYFLGNKQARVKRVADTQKCLRVSGKHNDLEEVGKDTYHHTMFEMLGNWSFGNYFKKRAIEWAWELLIDVYKLPEKRIYATVFGGDEKEGLEKDTESYNLWKMVLPEERILFCGKKDNFWEMGESGPCGPCSEIHIDLRSDDEIKKIPGTDLVNKDHPLVVEIWNLVFIQFNRLVNGTLENLPQKHVDTGMGLERLTMAIQKKTSNYDTDIFQPLINFVASRAGVKYGDDEEKDIALRVIVDHVRAVAFAIGDGQLPSNNGAGYVIRRILRRALRYGYTFLGFEEPFLNKIVPLLVKQFDSVFPEIEAQQEHIIRVIKEEENAFIKTLEKGLRMIDNFLEKVKPQDNLHIRGEQIFMLYDTYGFPKDLTMLILRERGLEGVVNKRWEEEFNKYLEEQKTRSRSAAVLETGDWIEVNKNGKSEFIGYEKLESKSKIVRYRKLTEKGKDVFQIVLDRTPFYAESGGQVGDTGILENDKEKIEIFDTKKENDLIVHFTNKLPSKLESTFKAKVNELKRMLTMNNHSATHLMHAALRSVLGPHVEQRGSLVNEKLLRFDFSHFAKLSEEEINKVEQIVNTTIRKNVLLDEKRNVKIDDAKKMGAMALFGEKYGERVRVITFGPNFSVELCGGTHVDTTGKIGFFKIISESSIAAGVRRIEAITAVEVDKYVHDLNKEIEEVKLLLNSPKDIQSAIKKLISENKSLGNSLESLQHKQAALIKADLLNKQKSIDGTTVIIDQINLENANEVKNLAFQLKNEIDNLFLVLGTVIDEKPQITVAISDRLIKEKKMNAGSIVREIAKEIKGGGGGQPFFATAGGKDVSGLQNALKKARNYVNG